MLNKLFLLFVLAGCSFSSGLYTDILKAQGLVEDRKFKKAIEVYESILLQKPSKIIFIKVSFQLGNLYSTYLGDHKKSLKYFEKIIQNSNEISWQVKALNKIAKINQNNLKDYKESEKNYKTLLSFKPQLTRYNDYLESYGMSLFHQAKYMKAKSIFKKLKEKNEYIRVYFYLGLIEMYQKKWSNSAKLLSIYIKLEKKLNKVIEAKYILGNVYESAELLNKAYEIYYSLLGVYPNEQVIKNRLDSLFKRKIARKR